MPLEDVDKIVNSILKFVIYKIHVTRDYIFDLNKFSDVSGKTGPYILYTYLRINKILKEENLSNDITNNIYNKFDRDLRIKILDYVDATNMAFNERKPITLLSMFIIYVLLVMFSIKTIILLIWKIRLIKMIG